MGAAEMDSVMRMQDRPKDVYGRPVQTGCLYQISKFGEMIIVRVYFTSQNILVAENIAKGPGERDRLFSVVNLNGFQWAQVDQEGVVIEPPVSYACPSVDDKISEIESRVLILRAELMRLELLACQALECRPGDGSQASEMVFAMIYNCSVGAEEICAKYNAKFVSCGGGR